MMAECSCVYVDCYDSETTEFFRDTIHVARKQHNCGECRRTIERGEEYEYVVANWDGSFSTHKTCSGCMNVRDKMFCEGFYYGTLWDDIREHVRYMDGKISSECLLSLTKRSRDRLFAIIEEVWEELEENDNSGTDTQSGDCGDNTTG